MKTTHKSVFAYMLVLGMPMATAPLVFAETGHQMEHMHMAQSSQSGQAATSSASMSSGEIKKVDKSAGKLTIKHGPLKNLDMPPMTMVFRVKDPAMLDEIKAGDKISFVADKIDGQLTVTQLQPGK